ARMAAWLTREHPLLHGELAHHWKLAGESLRAASHFGHAGVAAHRVGAYREAIRYLREALALSTENGSAERDRALWEQTLGTAFVSWSRYADARHHLLRALAAEGIRVPRSTAAASVSLVAQLLHQLVPQRRDGNPARRDWARSQARTLEALV